MNRKQIKIRDTDKTLQVLGAMPERKGDRFQASYRAPTAAGCTVSSGPGFNAISCRRGRSLPIKDFVYDPEIHRIVEDR